LAGAAHGNAWRRRLAEINPSWPLPAMRVMGRSQQGFFGSAPLMVLRVAKA
jgi:hypothetical protein